MPYIKPEFRNELDPAIDNLFSIMDIDPGQLNYAITKLCISFLRRTDGKYKDYNEVIGVLECAKQEFYRRAVSKYEDDKIAENGDVY